MTSVPLLSRHWYCPSCDSAARTVDYKTPMHPCKGLAGLLTPLVPVGEKAKHTAVERGDWIGTEKIQYDGNGRPVMSVVTETDDSLSTTVFAPTATLESDAQR
jgi:hypothetical protein